MLSTSSLLLAAVSGVYDCWRCIFPEHVQWRNPSDASLALLETICERFVLTLHTRKPLAVCHALSVADLPEAIHSASLKKNKGIVFSPKVKPPSPGTLALAGSPLKVFFNMGIL